ncbi:family 10 glycosylhydrolase [Flavisolibacter sp. BT320]|nr:family 10 glycosylhydrolase [Flavisolibacter longurius]
MKLKSFALAGLALSLAAGFAACSKSDPPAPPVDGGGGSGVNPPPAGTKKEVIMWVDLRSNLFGTYGRFSDTAEIRKILDQVKEVGVTSLIVDVKASSGYTIYPSAHTKQITSLDGKTFQPGVDYVEFMITEAKKRDLKVYASTMVMVEGDRSRNIGKVFEDPVWRDQYQSQVAEENGTIVPITTTGKNGFVNPARPEVQDRAINIMKEVATKYNVDGIVMDYARYADINADFSEFSKQEFIKFLETEYGDKNAKFMNFPKDVVTTWRTTSGQVVPATTGTYYKRWLVYRVKVIHDFVTKARAAVKSVKPNIKFGSYTGAWYTTYYQVGVNWASKTYDPFNDPVLRFDWAYPGYEKYGYAEQLDWLMTGNYFTQLMINDNPATAGQTYHWWSVEGSLNGGKYVTKGKIPVFGSIDMGNVSWNSKTDIRKALQLILQKADGVMLFDLVHVYAPQYNRLGVTLWDEIKEGVKQ